MKSAELLDNKLRVKFSYSLDTLNKVKSLDGRKWVPSTKSWDCAASFSNIEQLLEWDFILNVPLMKLWEKLNNAVDVKIESIPNFGNAELVPRDYQLQAVAFAEKNDYSCLIGDDMGIGKTIEALAILAYNPILRPALVVGPSAVKYKWEREINKWMPDEVVQVIDGKKNQEIYGSIVVINWDILFYSKMIDNPRWIAGKPDADGNKYDKDGKKITKTIKKFFPRDDLFEYDFSIIFGDEIHKINNPKAGRTIAFQALAKLTGKCIGLSGTPIKNRPKDFFNILNIIAPAVFDNRWRFEGRYCDRKHNGFGWDSSGSSNIEELHQKIKQIMIRRTIEEVLPELPKNQRIVVPFVIDNRKEYDEAFEEFKLLAESGDVAGIRFIIDSKLKQLAVEGKLKQSIKWITDYLESGKKLVVSCFHTKIADEVFNSFDAKKTVRITGGLGASEKDKRAEQFQNDPKINLAVCNIEAAGEGIDLFSANTTFNMEFRWDPTIHDQFERRVLRMGQTSDKCFSVYPVAVGTIEEELYSMIDSKRAIIDAVIDGKVTEDDSMFVSLMKNILDKPKPRQRRIR